jgi:sirohydrochlorin cobaltochelatase
MTTPAAAQPPSPSVGLVLFAHGARDPRWADTVEALARRIAALAPAVPVEPAYLELMTPDLAGAVERLVGRGVGQVVVAPVFLSAGGHVLRDLPARLAAIERRFPGVGFRVAPVLGCVPAVVDAMAAACIVAASR